MQRVFIFSIFCLVAASLALPARAQAIATPQSYTLNLTPAEVNEVYKALITQPFQEVQALVQKLETEIAKQNTAALKAARQAPKAEPRNNLVPKPKAEEPHKK